MSYYDPRTRRFRPGTRPAPKAPRSDVTHATAPSPIGTLTRCGVVVSARPDLPLAPAGQAPTCPQCLARIARAAARASRCDLCGSAHHVARECPSDLLDRE